MGRPRARKRSARALRPSASTSAPVGPPPGLEASRTTIGQQEIALLTFPLRRPALPAAFSAAEREVALALLEGKTNSEIAAARDTSVRTVANQVGAMFRKLGVHSRPEFVVKLGTEPVERTRRKGESGV